jgi:uncharacterized protein YbjT (DUF2867 family)
VAGAASRRAWIAGATGLTGGHLLPLLLADQRYTEVHACVRSASLAKQVKLTQHVVDFDRLDLTAPCDDAYCCLGTTIRKAGSQAAFRRVDFDYVVNFARAARAKGAQRFLLVSALGADSRSAIFYNRVKGEAEDALRQLDFAELHLFQPSFLLGERAEVRAGERLGIAVFSGLAAAMLGPLRKYRPIAAATVAKSMRAAAWRGTTGVSVYPSDQIASMAP